MILQKIMRCVNFVFASIFSGHQNRIKASHMPNRLPIAFTCCESRDRFCFHFLSSKRIIKTTG
ncbi:hypothetical protein CLOSTMETH_02804 [[Clostridium] methylpentosum DSM 5476]|uniref:Uncharacterized protein n=1 Tax=[Clostridium] methylpentosum DSM 5476 TaxID=537013 RepID=C0EG12_9FIRM|nr:hypothetical protein CLOSTMETH_02804 [[Clostridium] methylpentosum DSM 5476]